MHNFQNAHTKTAQIKQEGSLDHINYSKNQQSTSQNKRSISLLDLCNKEKQESFSEQNQPLNQNKISNINQMCHQQIIQFPFKIPDTDKFDQVNFHKNFEENYILPEYPVLKNNQINQYLSFEPPYLDLGRRTSLLLSPDKEKIKFQKNGKWNFIVQDVKIDNPQFTISKENKRKIDDKENQFQLNSSYYINVVGTQIGRIYGTAYFYIQFKNEETEQTKKYTLMYELSADIEENELQLQPIYVNDVIQNEYKEINLYITNLQNRGIKLQRIQSEYKKVSLISVLDQELGETLDNSNNNKSDYIIDLDKYPLQKNIKDKNIARILLKTEETGIFKDVIILTCSNNKFAIPIQFRVSNSVRFYKEYIDFGVIGVYNENQIQNNHEADLYIFNPTQRQIEILDIQVQFENENPYECIQVQAFDLDLKKYDCLKENQKLFIKPGEQNRKIGKMNVIGKVLSNEYMNNEPIRYFGKLFLITNETQSQNNYLNFAFTIIKNPIAHEPGLFNFYINPDNLPQTQQYYDQLQDKNIQYILFDKQKGVQQVSIRKQVILRGLGKNYLKIYEVIPESSYFHVEGVKQIQDSDSNISYAFDLKYVREFKYATNFNQISYLKLQISSEQTILPIQIMVYDKSLYCKTEIQEYSKCTSSLRNKNIEFGTVGLNEFRQKELKIKNSNPVDIIIYQIINKIDQIKIILLDIQNEDKKVIVSQKIIPRQGSKEQPLFTIKQGQIATFSFVLNATMESNVESEVIFRTSQENFTIPLSYQIIPGQVLVEPTILKFEQSFKGIQSQYTVELENTFKEPINIKSITSEDNRFYFKYDHNLQIQPGQKTKAFEIFFNSSFWQDDVPISLDQNYENKIKKILSGITYKDLNKHFKQVMEWQQFQKQQKNDIRSQIKIETSYVQEVILEVQVNMTQPIIIKENKIDFGLNQINQKINKPITIFNPSDYPLHLSFFISTSDFFQNSYLQQLSSKAQKQFGVQKLSVCAPEIEKYRSFEFYKNLNLIFIENGSNDQIQEYIIRAKDNGYSVKYPMDPIKNTFKSKKEVKNLIGEDFYSYLQKEKTLICKQGNIDNIQKHLIQREHLMRPLIYLYQNPSADKKTGWKQILSNIKEQEIEIQEISQATVFKNYSSKRLVNINASLYQKLILLLTDFLQIHQYPLFQKLTSFFYNNNSQESQQQFYLGQNQQIVEIPPHSNYTFNDLYYEPQLGSVSATLFIKNILTGLNLIPLYGQGGIGQLEIISLYQVENKQGKKQKTLIENLNLEEIGINGNLNFIFQVKPQDLSENGFQVLCQREFTLQNTGKLPVEIKKIMQNQNEPCESGFLKMDCNGFKLEPGEQKAFPITLIQPVQHIFDNQNDNLKQQFNTSLQFYAENYYFNFQLYVDYSEFLQNLKQQANNNEEQKLYWSKRLKGNQPNFLPYYAKIAIFSSLILFVITIYNFLTNNIIKAQKKQFGAKRIVSKLNNISNYSILERQVGFKVQLKSQQSNNQVYNIKAFIEKAKKNKDRHNKNSYNYQQQETNNKVHISLHTSSENPDSQIQSKQKKNSQNLEEQKNNLQQNMVIDNISNIKTKPENNSENQNIIKNQKDVVNQENIKKESENKELIQNNKNLESNEKKANQIPDQEAQVPIPKQKNKKAKKQEKKHKKKDQSNKQNDETENQHEQNQNSQINAEGKTEKVEKKQKDDSIIVSHNQSQIKDSDASFSQNLEEEQNQSKICSQKDLLNKSLSNKSVQNYHKYENKYVKQGHHQKNYSYSNKQQQQKQQQQINFDDNGFIDLQKKVPGPTLKPGNLIFPQLQLKATSKQKEKQTALKNEWEEENIDLILNEGKQEKNVIDENEFKKIDEDGQALGKNSQNIDDHQEKQKNQELKKQTNQENQEKLKEQQDQKKLQQNEKNMNISQKTEEAKQENEKFNELEKSQTKMQSPKIITNLQDQLNQQSFISQEKLEEENSDIDLNIENQSNNENDNYNSDSDDQLGSGESLNEEEKFDDKNNFGFGIKNELEKIESLSSEQQLQFQQQQQQQQETQQLDQSLEFSKFQNDFFYQNKDSQVSQQKEEDSSNAVSEDDEINFKYFNLFKGGNKESKFKSFLQNNEESINEQEQQKSNIDIRSQNKTQTLFGAQGNLNFYNDKKLSQQQYLNNSQSNNSDSDLSNSQNHLNLGKLDSNQSSNNNSFGIQEQLKINKLEKNMENSKNPFSAFFGNHHENPSVDINESGIFSNYNNKQDDQVYTNEDQTQAFTQISQNLQKQQNQQQSPLFDPQEAQKFNQQIKNQDFYDQQQQFQNNDNLKPNNNNSYFQPKIIPQVNQIDQNFSYSQQLSFQNPMLMYSYLQQQQSISDNFPNQMAYENNEEAEEDLEAEQKDLSYKDDSAHISQDEQVSGRQKLEKFNRNFNNNTFNSSQNYSQNPYSSDSSSNQKGSFQGSDYKNRKSQTKKPNQYEETKQQQDKNIYQQQSSQPFYSNNSNYPFNNYGNNNNMYQDYYDDEEDEEDEYYQDYNSSNNYRYTNKNTSFNTQNSNIRYQKSYQPSSRQNYSSKYQGPSNQNRNYNSGYKSSKVINQGQNQSYQKTPFKKSSFTSGKGLRQGFNKYQNPSNSNSNINSSQNTGKQHGSSYHQNKPQYQNNNNSYFQYDYQNYQEESDGGGNSYQQGPPSKFNKKKDFSIQRAKKPFRGKPHYSRQDPDCD